MWSLKQNIKTVKIEKSKIVFALFFILLAIPVIAVSQPVYSPELDSAYHMLDRKDVKGAIPLFEAHIKMYPTDTRVWLQLAYIYDDEGQLSKSYQYFSYVARTSLDPKEKETAEASAMVMKEKINANAKRSIEINVQSFYDTYQKNYITGLNIYYKFRISKEVFVGPYLDLYTDSKSSPGLIYNDRYIELGLFGRFYALPQLYLELRTGYVHEFDIDSSKISISPRAVFSWRFGSGQDFIPEKPKTKTGFFVDAFTMLSYETKYQNGFSQTGISETFRNNIKGYSYLDFFLAQNLTLDSRRLDYNNNVSFGGGVRYKPNLIYFPYFYVEPNYKFYLIKDPVTGIKRTGSFQIYLGIAFSVSIKG